LKIGIIFCGRNAPGVHNTIDGLLRFAEHNPGTTLFGFLGGTKGFFE